MSGSMSGSRWTNAVKGAKQLIDYIRKHHLDKPIVQLVIILFDESCKVVHNEKLSESVPESRWEPLHGGTDFGLPLEQAIKSI